MRQPMHSSSHHVSSPPARPPPLRLGAGSTLNHWPFPWKHLPEAYCYLLTHCGTPCVFYDHLYFDEGLRKHVLELVHIRKKYMIHAKSEVRARAAGEAAAAGSR